jgi:hypothetical protein
MVFGEGGANTASKSTSSRVSSSVKFNVNFDEEKIDLNEFLYFRNSLIRTIKGFLLLILSE